MFPCSYDFTDCLYILTNIRDLGGCFEVQCADMEWDDSGEPDGCDTECSECCPCDKTVCSWHCRATDQCRGMKKRGMETWVIVVIVAAEVSCRSKSL